MLSKELGSVPRALQGAPVRQPPQLLVVDQGATATQAQLLPLAPLAWQASTVHLGQQLEQLHFHCAPLAAMLRLALLAVPNA